MPAAQPCSQLIGGEVMEFPDGQVKDCCPVRWLEHGRLAVAALPEHFDLSTAGPIREQLLTVINRGARTLIVDMSATISCDHAGVAALARVYQRAAASGTELRVVVSAPVVRRVLSIGHIDRLVSIYPVLEAALAPAGQVAIRLLVPEAGRAGSAVPAPRGTAGAVSRLPAKDSCAGGGAVVTPAVVWQVLDAFPDGVAVTGDADDVVLVNRRLEEMFGYQHGELSGRPLRFLVPAAREPLPGPADTNPPYPLVAPIAGDGMLLTGVRKDGDTFPVQVTRAPVTARTGHFTLAVIRDGDGPDPAARKRYLEETLGSITGSIFEVGLKLNASSDAPPGDLRRRLDEASRLLDGIVNEIYAAMFRAYRPRA
jgi:anti-anti-sigma factor